MVMFFVITLVNACLSNEFVNTSWLRVPIGSFPVNIFDMLILAAVLISALPRRTDHFHTERVHPAVLWALTLFTLAVAGAGIAAMFNGASARSISTTARNLAEVPVLVYLGYRALSRP